MAEGEKPDFDVVAVRERAGRDGHDIFTKTRVIHEAAGWACRFPSQ